MDIRKVKKLIELLDESGIAEIEITEGEESVRISRYSQNAPPGGYRSSLHPRRSLLLRLHPLAAPATEAEAAPAEPEEIRVPGNGTDGGNVLCVLVAGRGTLCPGRRHCERRRHACASLKR